MPQGDPNFLTKAVTADLSPALGEKADQVASAIIRHAATTDRTATVEHNAFQRYPWMLRCYGRGRSIVASGMPKHFGSEAVAREKAALWIASGVEQVAA